MKFVLSLFAFASLFSLCSASWVQKASLNIARSDFHAVVDGDAVYVAGGCVNQPQANFCNNVTDTLEIYYPKTDKWVFGASMKRPRYRYASALINHKIYFVGGRKAAENPTDGDYGTVVQEIDVYDTQTNTWRTLDGQLCNDCTYISDAVGFAIGSKVYVTGGYTPTYGILNRTIVLDTADNKNVDQFRIIATAEKIIVAGDPGAVVIGTKAYVYGGFGSDECQPFGTMEIFDSVTNTWTLGAKDTISIGRGDMGMVALQNNIFVMGGETKQQPCTPGKSVSIPIETITRYDITTNTWSNTTQHLKFPRFRFSGFVYDNKLYDVGGQNAQVINSFPVTNLVYALDLSQYASAATTINAAFPIVIACFALLFLW